MKPLSPNLRRLEAESIFTLRETVAEFQNPAMLYSVEKTSSVMLHLALKAFFPAKPPFPLLHVDTNRNFRETIAFRDWMAARAGMDLLVHVNEEGMPPVEALRQALDKWKFDAAFADGRHDGPGEPTRVFPLSNWTERDLLAYIAAEQIPIAPHYFAKERPVERRDDAPIVVDDASAGPAEADASPAGRPMRFPIQAVNRLAPHFECFVGTLASGRVRIGDEVVVAVSGQKTRIERIVTMGGDLEQAEAPDAVTLVLTDKIDASRGDILCGPVDRPDVVDQFAAHLTWMSEEPLLPGRSYLMKICGRTLPASVTEIKYRLESGSEAKISAKTLQLGEIGFCNLAASMPLAIDSYEANRVTGAFNLIDRATHGVAATGAIAFALRRAGNLHPQQLAVGKAERSRLKHQQPKILWFTGFSGSGKSTVANLVEKELLQRRVHSIMLDGDNIRHGLSKDLGFTEADRVENIRRIGEVAKLMVDAGLIVLCAFISPFASERRMVRALVEAHEFVEIFLDTPLEVCIERDPKGLYKKALAGQIKNFTGVDQAYERPQHAEIVIGGECQRPEQAAERILRFLDATGTFDSG